MKVPENHGLDVNELKATATILKSIDEVQEKYNISFVQMLGILESIKLEIWSETDHDVSLN